MSYCGTFLVKYLSQIAYNQLAFPDDASFGTFLAGTLIPAAQKFVDSYCGHDFCSNSGTITLDGSGKETLLVSRNGLVNGAVPHLIPLPLIALTGVTIDNVAEGIGEFQIYDSYVTREDNIFDEGRQNVELVGSWGYMAVPDDITLVTGQLCANVLQGMLRTRMIPDMIAPILTGGGDLSALFRSPAILTKTEKEVLDKYKFHDISIG